MRYLLSMFGSQIKGLLHMAAGMADLRGEVLTKACSTNDLETTTDANTSNGIHNAGGNAGGSDSPNRGVNHHGNSSTHNGVASTSTGNNSRNNSNSNSSSNSSTSGITGSASDHALPNPTTHFQRKVQGSVDVLRKLRDPNFHLFVPATNQATLGGEHLPAVNRAIQWLNESVRELAAEWQNTDSSSRKSRQTRKQDTETLRQLLIFLTSRVTIPDKGIPVLCRKEFGTARVRVQKKVQKKGDGEHGKNGERRDEERKEEQGHDHHAGGTSWTGNVQPMKMSTCGQYLELNVMHKDWLPDSEERKERNGGRENDTNVDSNVDERINSNSPFRNTLRSSLGGDSEDLFTTNRNTMSTNTMTTNTMTNMSGAIAPHSNSRETYDIHQLQANHDIHHPHRDSTQMITPMEALSSTIVDKRSFLAGFYNIVRQLQGRADAV